MDYELIGLIGEGFVYLGVFLALVASILWSMKPQEIEEER